MTPAYKISCLSVMLMASILEYPVMSCHVMSRSIFSKDSIIFFEMNLRKTSMCNNMLKNQSFCN